jgi:hypothetical protein
MFNNNYRYIQNDRETHQKWQFCNSSTSFACTKTQADIPALCPGHGCFRCLYYNTLTYLLIELSPSWEAANCAVTQEFPSKHTAHKNLENEYEPN